MLDNHNESENKQKSVRVKCLEKFRSQLEDVNVSSFCQNLTRAGFFRVSDLSLLLIPVLNSIQSLLLLVEKQLERLQGDEEDKLWNCFLRGMFEENPSLAFDMALESEKLAFLAMKKMKLELGLGVRKKKLEIGAPTDFRHIMSASGAPSAEVQFGDVGIEAPDTESETVIMEG